MTDKESTYQQLYKFLDCVQSHVTRTLEEIEAMHDSDEDRPKPARPKTSTSALRREIGYLRDRSDEFTSAWGHDQLDECVTLSVAAMVHLDYVAHEMLRLEPAGMDVRCCLYSPLDAASVNGQRIGDGHLNGVLFPATLAVALESCTRRSQGRCNFRIEEGDHHFIFPCDGGGMVDISIMELCRTLEKVVDGIDARGES